MATATAMASDSAAVTFFGLETINRVSFLREDRTFISQAFEHESSLFIPFVDGQAYTGDSGTDLLFLGQHVESNSGWSSVLERIGSVLDTEKGWLVESGFTATFLGLREYGADSGDVQVFKYKEYVGIPIFALDLHPGGDTLIKKADVQFILDRYQPLGRMQAFSLSNEVASIFSHANMYLDWLRKYLYCPGCGSKIYPVHCGTKLQCGNTKPDAKCPVQSAAVSNVCFPRTDPVVIVAIVDRQFSKICLARSRRRMGDFVMYSTIAGFMEPGETVEHACQREVWEETGVKVGPADVEILHTQPWPYPSNLMIGCLGVVDFNGDNETINLEHDKELADARWFDLKLVSEAFSKHDKTSTAFLKYDNTISFPGRTAIAHQLIEYAVSKHNRINGNL